MDTQTLDVDCGPASERGAGTLRAQKIVAAVLVASFLMASCCTDAAHSQVRAFKLKDGHLSALIVDQGAQLARMVRVDVRGREVGTPFDVLVQHRSGPEDQDIDDRWARADSIITCFPASIANPKIRAKAILKDKPGAIEIRRYSGGILIVEPTRDRRSAPALLAGPAQKTNQAKQEISNRRTPHQ